MALPGNEREQSSLCLTFQSHERQWRGIAGKPGIREILILPWQQRTDNLSLGHCNFGDGWLLSLAQCWCLTNDMRDSRSRQRITLIRRRLHTVSTVWWHPDFNSRRQNIKRRCFRLQTFLIWLLKIDPCIFILSFSHKTANTNHWVGLFLSHSSMIRAQVNLFLFWSLLHSPRWMATGLRGLWM